MPGRQESESKDPSPIERLLAIIDRLRGDGGCPWDREQTLATLRPFLVEECYELLEAIDSGDADHHCEELGDVLLQILLQSHIREEEGRFTIHDVARVLADKLVRRHPHVFGDVQVTGSDDVVRNWNAIKATEKEKPRASLLDGIPIGLPALPRAQRLQARASKVGFDWSDMKDVLAKVDEELCELREALAVGAPDRVEAELGDLLFAVVNACRFQKVGAEDALRRTSAKFERRFRHVEQALQAEGKTLGEASLEMMERHWQAAKLDEREA